MKLYVLSDLHNEFSPFAPEPGDCDLVILAGDIDVQTRGVKWANESFRCPVIYCAGNHEYYKGHIDHTLRKMRETALPHVHVLENQVWVCNQTRFLSTTGWTDFSCTGDAVAAMVTCGMWMNDFQVIRAEDSFRRLRPADVIEKNRDAFDFLMDELNKPFDGTTIVITHHCPALEAVGDKHDGHLNAAYSNQWHALLPMVDVWIFGHTHRAVDMEIGGCRLISNPRGYPEENTGFIADFTIEI
ncbi:metallophosphoesterase family protein [Pseudomonas sp. Irchel 3A7]|uniref:metallophosphoesterase family protein n=1 Tax=Pseudomonas sp. Irchel 3A7 TaxID=2008913 RepID=UPI000BA2E814|nr:metallophosphoesterase family protein [Pseudomonas sp. Irchel 3A7]